MDTYTVDHNGSCRSKKDGFVYGYAAGIPVGLPDDVAAALGDSATLFAKGKQHEEGEKEEVKADETADKEEPAKESKSAKKAPKDKMVKNDDTVTK